MLDNTISNTLHKELENNKYNQQLNESSQVIYNVCMRIYGVKEKNKPPVKKDIKEWCWISEWREIFKKANCFANVDKKEGLLKIWQDPKQKHSALSKAENLRKRWVKWKKDQEGFFQEPYK